MDEGVTSSRPPDPPASHRAAAPAPPKRSLLIPAVIAGGVIAILGLGLALVLHAESQINQVALASEPRPVTVIGASDTTFRDSRKYVGTIKPWIEANVGPQYISVYVDTVLVRPGATVQRGEVLATLDCRNASAASLAVAAEARAIDARQRAVADESARMKTLLDGGFIDPNSVEVKQAEAASEEAKLASSAGQAGRHRPRGQRLHPALAVRRRDRHADDRSRSVRATGYAHRLGRRPQHRAHDLGRTGDRLRCSGPG